MHMYILKKTWEQGKCETFLPPNFVETPDYFSLQYIYKERNAYGIVIAKQTNSMSRNGTYGIGMLGAPLQLTPFITPRIQWNGNGAHIPWSVLLCIP